MIEILRDQLWQFVGVVVGFIAIFISLFSYWYHRKELSYEIISDYKIISDFDIKDDMKNKLQILYNGKEVQDVHLILIKIINSGNIPIKVDDYDRQITLSFGKKAQVLDYEIAECSHESIEVYATIENKDNSTKIELNKFLLNGGDFVILKILVTQFEDISVHGHIVGVKKIQKLPKKNQSFVHGVILGLMLFLVTTAVGITVGFSKEQNFIIALFILLSILIVYFYGHK